MKGYFQVAGIAMLALTLAACGSSGSSSSSGSTTLSSTQSNEVGSLMSSLGSSFSNTTNTSESPMVSSKVVATISCPTSGSLTVDTTSTPNTITYSNCITEYDSDGDGVDDTRITADGSLSLVTVSGTTTISYDLTNTTADLSAGTSETYSMSGTVTQPRIVPIARMADA